MRGLSSRDSSSGFTLIELLVVLVIVALFSGMVVVSIGDSLERKLLSEAERLQAVIVAASDEAVYSGNEYGVHLSKEGYLVLRWERLTRQWVLNQAKAFAAHELPEGMIIEWTIDGFIPPDQGEAVNFEFGEEGEVDEEANGFDLSALAESEDGEQLQLGQAVDVQPQLLLLSSAELSVFEVDFIPEETTDARHRVRVYSDGFALPDVKVVSGESPAADNE